MITYPVNVETTRWSAVRISDNVIVKHNQKWPRADGGEIVGLNPDIALLLEVETAQPAYNAATQRLERDPVAVIDIPNNTHTHNWTIVAIPQSEIDDAAELAAVKALYLDLKNHVGTTVFERATRLENVVARIMKDMYQP